MYTYMYCISAVMYTYMCVFLHNHTQTYKHHVLLLTAKQVSETGTTLNLPLVFDGVPHILFIHLHLPNFNTLLYFSLIIHISNMNSIIAILFLTWHKLHIPLRQTYLLQHLTWPYLDQIYSERAKWNQVACCFILCILSTFESEQKPMKTKYKWV